MVYTLIHSKHIINVTCIMYVIWIGFLLGYSLFRCQFCCTTDII